MYNGHELGETPAEGKGQGGLAYCSPWGCKESDMQLGGGPPRISPKQPPAILSEASCPGDPVRCWTPAWRTSPLAHMVLRFAWNGKFPQCPNGGQQHSGARMVAGFCLKSSECFLFLNHCCCCLFGAVEGGWLFQPKENWAECELTPCNTHLSILYSSRWLPC